MTEPFDAVLADIRRCAVGWFAIPALANTMGKLADRLSAAHAAEVAERDARIAELEISCAQAVEFAQYVEDAAKGGMAERAKHYLSLPYSQELTERLARAETAERDAGELRDTLREARRWIGDGDMGDGMHRSIWTPAYTAIVDRVDAAIATTEQADE